MKVVFCNTIKSWGGGEKWHCETAIELAKQGHDVSFILRSEGIIESKLKHHNISAIHFSIGNLSFLNPLKQIQLITIFKRIKPDAIILNRPAELKVVALAAKLSGIKKIVYRRGSDVVVKNSFFNRILLERTVTHIIANSKATQASLLKSGLKIAKKITIINNGIKPTNQTYSTTKNRIPIIGGAGRLDIQKRFDYLIEIAALLKKRGHKFQIHIAGEGEKRDELTQQINKQGLENEVILKGFIEDISAFFTSIDLFALTSQYEGFGYVMAEAMMAHKPVIAFDNSSANDIVTNNETGFLVPAFDIELFTEKIELLLIDENLRITMGEKGHRKAMENFLLSSKTKELTNCLMKHQHERI